MVKTKGFSYRFCVPSHIVSAEAHLVRTGGRGLDEQRPILWPPFFGGQERTCKASILGFLAYHPCTIDIYRLYRTTIVLLRIDTAKPGQPWS